MFLSGEDSYLSLKSQEARLLFLLRERAKLKEELRDRLEELEMSREEFNTYISNPENFSPKEWEFISNEHEKIKREIQEIAEADDDSPVALRRREMAERHQGITI